MLLKQRENRFNQTLDGLWFAQELAHFGTEPQRLCQTGRMVDFTCEHNGALNLPAGLVWVAQQGQGEGVMGVSADGWIMTAVGVRMPAMSLSVIKREATLYVLASANEISDRKGCRPRCVMCLQH